MYVCFEADLQELATHVTHTHTHTHTHTQRVRTTGKTKEEKEKKKRINPTGWPSDIEFDLSIVTFPHETYYVRHTYSRATEVQSISVWWRMLQPLFRFTKGCQSLRRGRMNFYFRATGFRLAEGIELVAKTIDSNSLYV